MSWKCSYPRSIKLFSAILLLKTPNGADIRSSFPENTTFEINCSNTQKVSFISPENWNIGTFSLLRDGLAPHWKQLCYSYRRTLGVTEKMWYQDYSFSLHVLCPYLGISINMIPRIVIKRPICGATDAGLRIQIQKQYHWATELGISLTSYINFQRIPSCYYIIYKGLSGCFVILVWAVIYFIEAGKMTQSF